MIQIDWGNAPKWANWWAMDADGKTYWYEHKPYIDYTCNCRWAYSFDNGCIDIDSNPYNLSGIDWRQTLTLRPGYSENPNSHCKCKQAEFTRDLDQDSDAMCGRL